LGLGDTTTRTIPTEITSLTGLNVKQASGGLLSGSFLTFNGRLFSVGNFQN
jgi:hypothetical protein